MTPKVKSTVIPRFICGIGFVQENLQGKAGHDCDCVPRAFAFAGHMDYYDTVERFEERAGFEYGQGCPPMDFSQCFDNGEFSKEIKFPPPVASDASATHFWFYGPSITLADAIKRFNKGRYVFRSALHAFAVIDGIIYDNLGDQPDLDLAGADKERIISVWRYNGV